MNIDDRDCVNQVDPHPNVKALGSENYKSLQVNRSNTTTGYMAAGGKTQVHLSQNLQHPANPHLTSNGMSILANGAPSAIAAMKQSYGEEPTDTYRLKRDQSDNNVGATRVQMGNKN